MPELILSDITVMGAGYCVIGLERLCADSYRSVRPMPPWGFAWREPFRFKRGDGATVQLRPTNVVPPHVEDRQSTGLKSNGQQCDEEQLVECLRKAEVSADLGNLFGCRIQSGSQAGRALWVNPAEAARSICGCEHVNVRFRLFPEPEGFNLRGDMVLSSEERISSIPIVDREWRRFVSQLVRRVQRSNPLPLVERFLNRSITMKLLSVPVRFARIGLPRPRGDERSWLMLDSLFPQPQETWLDLL